MKNLILIFFFSCFFGSLNSQIETQEIWSRVKIFTQKSSLPELMLQGLELGHLDFEDDGIVSVMKASQIKFLETHNIPFEILVEDETALFLRRNASVDFFASENIFYRNNVVTNCQSIESIIQTPANFSKGSMGGYLTYTEMLTHLDLMYAKYPELITQKQSIGKSIELRDIFTIKISDLPELEEEEPEILYSAMNHRREPTAMHQMIFFMWYLLENYENDEAIRNLVNNRALHFIPLVNPDGYVYNENIAPDGGGMWRKNRRQNEDGSYGVDLNRNYGVGWGANDSGSSPDPSGLTYRGTGAFSEPETQAIRDFALSRDFNIVLDYHAFGSFLIQPWSYPDAEPMNEEDSKIFENFGLDFTHYNCYKPGTDETTVGYATNGVAYDWYFGRVRSDNKKTYAWIPEVGRANNGFWPTQDMIIPLAKENLYQNIQAALMSGAFAEAKLESKLALNNAVEELQISVQRLGLLDAEIKLEFIDNAYVQFEGNSIVIPAGTLNFVGDVTKKKITFNVFPGLPEAFPININFVLSSGGIEVPYSLDFVWMPAIISDNSISGDFETNWTTNGSWSFVKDPANENNFLLTDSPGANYKSPFDYWVSLKYPLDLSNADQAYLSFRLKHSLQACKDQLFVEIGRFEAEANPSDFEPVCGNLTIFQNINFSGGKPSITRTSKEWQQAIFPLNNYVGLDSLALRFKLDVDHYIEDDGVYLDDLQIITANNRGPLPVELLDFEAVLLNNKEVKLNWQTTSEINNDYFSIERSSNGLHFESIAKLPSKENSTKLNNYHFIDTEANFPINYYRLKIVDLDGSFEYSQTISINIEAPVSIIKIFPNPVSSELSLEVKSDANYMLPFFIYDLLGQQIQEGNIKLGKGRYIESIDVSHLPLGVYFLIIGKNQMQLQRKIVKN